MNSAIKYRQRGTVLIVSLLILLVMTLIGVSAVSTTSLEEKMATSFQHSEITFQATESTINAVIQEGTPGSQGYDGANDPLVSAVSAGVGDTSTTRTFNMDPNGLLPNTTLTGTATIVYNGETIAPGYSMKVGGGGIADHTFTIGADANIAATSTSSPHRQGVARTGPSSL